MVNFTAVPSKCPDTRWCATGVLRFCSLSITGRAYSGSTQSGVTWTGPPGGVATQSGAAAEAAAAGSRITLRVSARPAADAREARPDVVLMRTPQVVGRYVTERTCAGRVVEPSASMRPVNPDATSVDR